MEIQKTKKEHYVPRCYLKRWIKEKEQINVFDLLNNKNWISNIENVASERYFYDMDYSELSKKALELLHEHEIYPENDEQFVEHFFSMQVEDEYSKLLKKLVDNDITPWYENNCFFISLQDKLKLSICLTYQLIRSKQVRNMIRDSSSLLEKFMKDINVCEKTIKKYTLREGDEKFIQGNMFFNIDKIFDLVLSFYRLSWTLGVNRTNFSLFTSDNPIGMYPHIKNSMITMNGIGSPGIEVYFPLSPQYILIMWDSNYHKGLKILDRRYISLTDSEVKRYNSLCVYNCSQYIYSKEKDFGIVEKFINDNPNYVKMNISISYGGKTYTPE